MSDTDTDTLQALSTLLKRKPSKRERKQRAKQNVSAFIRRAATAAAAPATKPATAAFVVEGGRVEKSEAETRRERNASALRAADKLVSEKSRKLQRDIIELMRAQQEHRNPKLKRKTRLTYFDFEDES
ncbi:hypothetical protein IWW37_004178 [Coemansia sp. RSA 2050]|nr:hypothetical protein IWW37_004178 [Coemansia sp. RSA 2050]KAJ2731357.1 hypothetical protein IW152_004609 [Coemansia sp. BCRC 34962]